DLDREDDHVHSIGKDVLGLSTERRLDLKAVGHSLQIKLKDTGGTVRLDLRDNSRVVGNPEVVRPRHHVISNGKSAYRQRSGPRAFSRITSIDALLSV